MWAALNKNGASKPVAMLHRRMTRGGTSVISPTSYKRKVITYPLDLYFHTGVILFPTKREGGNVRHVTAVSQPDKKRFQWRADSSRALRSIKT